MASGGCGGGMRAQTRLPLITIVRVRFNKSPLFILMECLHVIE